MNFDSISLPLYFWYNTEAWTGVTTCWRGPIQVGGGVRCCFSCNWCDWAWRRRGADVTGRSVVGRRQDGRPRWRREDIGGPREEFVGGTGETGGCVVGRRERRRGGGVDGCGQRWRWRRRDGGDHGGGGGGGVTELTRRHVAVTRSRYAPVTAVAVRRRSRRT